MAYPYHPNPSHLYNVMYDVCIHVIVSHYNDILPVHWICWPPLAKHVPSHPFLFVDFQGTQSVGYSAVYGWQCCYVARQRHAKQPERPPAHGRRGDPHSFLGGWPQGTSKSEAGAFVIHIYVQIYIYIHITKASHQATAGVAFY